MQKLQVEVTNVFERNLKAIKAIVANIGGADSSKSHSLAQVFISKFFSEENKAFLITRKTLPALKISAYKLVIDLLKEYDRYKYVAHNKSEHTLIYRDNFMLFTSVDDPEKIKSAEFNYIWMEEANEFSYEDFTILKLRLRRRTSDGNPNRMYLSYNPKEKYGWLNEQLPKEDAEFIHSTYKDNPFAADKDIDVLERLKEQDESYYLIYALGQYAEIKGQIHFLNIADELPDTKETIYGLDFGFVNPNALLEIRIDIEAMKLYFRELIFETGQTNADLIKEMKEVIPPEHRKRDMYADAAEPDRIEEIYQAGFNVRPSMKGKGSVVNGINFLNRFGLYSIEENVNVNREFRSYKRKVDKAGKVQEEPIKFNDHSPNAARYAIHTHLWERLLELEPSWVYHKGMVKKPMPTPEEDKIWPPKAMEEKKPKPLPTPKEEESDDESWVV